MSDHKLCVSVIVPVYNDAAGLFECLNSLKAQAHTETEIVVVNDASTDESAAVADSAGVKLFSLLKNSGPAAARNYGAARACGDILFFVDADVVLAPGGIERVRRTFDERRDLAALFGSYDASPRASGVISQYRNLLHHFVHQNGQSEASTFWAGCGAIRREVFAEIGGFDEARYRRPSIEDIELGYRLRRRGYRIFLDKSLQGKHLKHWTLFSFIHTDIFGRAIPWSRLILETKMLPNDLNLKWDQRASFVLVCLACLSLVLGFFWFQSFALAVVAILVLIGLNRRIYLFFARQRGWAFALACVPLHFAYYLYSGFSYIYVRALNLLGL